MSLYQVQKLIYQLNRDPRARERYASEPVIERICESYRALGGR